MNEEEMKRKIDEAEALAEAKEKEIESLKSQRANQNAYITKLEGKNQALEATASTIKDTVNSQPAMDPAITEYFRKKRREDYTEQAYTELKVQVGEATFNVVKPEVDDFLKAYMTENNVSVKYIIDAFHLLLGKAYANPNHPIHGGKATTPVVKQAMPIVDTTKVVEQIDRMQTPGMTNEDQPMATPSPVEPQKVANTKDAMASFKNRLFSGGLDSTKFE